ncbi:hypothetical protein E2C01_080211 [Portunus trituberculatus]|uniref:Uncharacterized protein n=1 Tax=Portunus trituberculatus TaxID=210409 RepID=A0A5B7ISJ8_PORTR|nr:hypothetical protein [Portunus trituberculatus]
MQGRSADDPDKLPHAAATIARANDMMIRKTNFAARQYLRGAEGTSRSVCRRSIGVSFPCQCAPVNTNE